eukprot:5235788-Pyramimonas_sp.AAC.1
MPGFSKNKTILTETFGAPRRFLGSGLGPPGGASGAAPGTLRAPAGGVQLRVKKSARTVKKFTFMPLLFLYVCFAWT